MSKYRDGNYDTGEPRFIYLKIWKHMPEMHPRTGKLRRKLWIAKCIARDFYLTRKYS